MWAVKVFSYRNCVRKVVLTFRQCSPARESIYHCGRALWCYSPALHPCFLFSLHFLTVDTMWPVYPCWSYHAFYAVMDTILFKLLPKLSPVFIVRYLSNHQESNQYTIQLLRNSQSKCIRNQKRIYRKMTRTIPVIISSSSSSKQH